MSRSAPRVPFRIFVASPGDLGEEREAVRRAAAEVNDTLAPHFGVIVEVYGWEQEVPGAGRPQAIINRQVDECDLFVGMLWQRWGTPTGTHASGFLEEYERAFARRKQTGAPEMWVMFKEVPASSRSDPGKQLKKVLGFRGRLVREKALLFVDVRGPADVEAKARQWLFRHLADRAPAGERSVGADASASRPPAVPASTSSAVEVAAPADGGEPFTAPELLRRALEGAASAVRATDFDGYAEVVTSATHLDLLRSRLFNAALLSLLYGGGPLGVHEINALYQDRAAVQLVPPETIYVFRMLVGDDEGVFAGWYWVAGGPLAAPRDLLVATVGDTSRPQVERSRAVHLLTLAREPLAAAEFEAALDAAADPASATVATALLAHAAALGTLEHDAVLHRAGWLREGPLAGDAAGARLSILRRCAPTVAAGEAVRLASAAPDAVADAVAALGSVIATSTVAELRTSKVYAVRRAAFRELVRRGELTPDALREAVADFDFHVRAAALGALVAAGEPLSADAIREALNGADKGGLFGDPTPPKPEPIILALFRRMARQGRPAPSGYFLLLDGPLAYETNGLEHFASAGDGIRHDVADGFAKHKRESAAAVRTLQREFGKDRVPDPVLSKGLDDYVRSRFVEAGLRVLAEYGSAADVPLARQYARPRALFDMLPVVRMLARFGGPEDVPALLTLEADGYGEVAEAAATAALALAPGPNWAAQVLLKSEKPVIVARALLALRPYALAEVAPVVEPVLRRDREDVRPLALALLVELSDAAQLRELEGRYRSAGTYYYNVGCWLDRVLHAPEPLRSGFRRELARVLRAGLPVEDVAEVDALARRADAGLALAAGEVKLGNAA